MSEDAGNESATRGRQRRTTAKKVNYAKEQEFSDEDVFEDSEPDDAPRGRKSGGGGRGRARKSNASSAATGVRMSTVTQSAAAHADEMENGDQEVFDARPVYTEKGYDPSLPPLRERFPFLPEYEEDGSPKIELIVGRRPVDEKEDNLDKENMPGETSDGEEKDDDDDDDDDKGNKRRPKRGAKKNETKPSSKKNDGPVEYEYLVKYKGRSYLHLEWKTGADLESMNKSAKGIYRRYLKKLAQGTDDDLESPEFDPSFIEPEKILDEAEQEVSVELSDKELLRWQKDKKLAEQGQDDDDDGEKDGSPTKESNADPDKEEDPENNEGNEEEDKEPDPELEWTEEDIDFTQIPLERLRKIVQKDGSYYASVKGSDNPYRDGYVTEPPKKPRASYLFFQCCMRTFFLKKHPGATQSELMTILGDHWRTMSDEEREPFVQLAREESAQYEKERLLLEKAQRANEVWQPLRRCLMVLDRLAKDSFADIFLEPVDLNDFPDYGEIVDTPMDLGTVRKKLAAKKYQAPEQFARDMRKVWNNCKIYNQHGSAIWHVADYMSKQFERLYHAWVLEFRERYLRWADPRARPWEHTCRQHDGKCKTADHQMVLCDHCDAMYGIHCLKPPLKKIPTKAWHCPDCRPKLKSAKGARMLSAVAENAARKRAELGDLPKKKVKQVMYLVKWKGLGYEFCTWETSDDISDSQLVADFHRLNNAATDEPDMKEEVLDNFLKETKHIDTDNAGGILCIPALRAQLYAQSRAFQFAKFGMDLPERMYSECGAITAAVADEEGEIDRTRSEVIACVNDIVHRVSRGEKSRNLSPSSFLPPPMIGEYDAIVPITAKGLMMNVGEINGSVAFLGYRQFPDGTKGPSEVANLIKNVGDKIVSVDGVSTVGKSFKEVINMLRESGKNKFAYMRFLENKFTVCDSALTSVGPKGRYAIDELRKKFVADRQKEIVKRQVEVVEEEERKVEEEPEDEEEASVQKDGSDDGSDGSEGEFEPDTDDEDAVKGDQSTPVMTKPDPTAASSTTQEGSQEKVEVKKEVRQESPEQKEPAGADTQTNVESERERPVEQRGLLCRHETSRSLGFRLLDVDVGYSSDEGGDENCAHFVDGVDDTFFQMAEVEECNTLKKSKAKQKEEAANATVPAKQNEFSALGDRAKLAVAVSLSTKTPEADDFDNFPQPSSKELEEIRRKAEEAEASAESPNKTSKRSTVKVEQVSVATGEVLHIWANVESAAATLQLPLNELKQVLRSDMEYDEDIGDEVGGYKWRYALAGAKVTAGTGSTGRGGGGKKAKEAWLEFRDKLYDPAEPHIYKNNNRLRDYQVDGVNWLASTWYKRQGCILADEMGLGKTVQIVCFIEHLFRVEKIQRPYLVVVPLSTVEHWRREFEGWTDMVCCVYHDRQRIWRDVLREYEWYFEDRPHTAEYLKFDVLVTTYDTLIGDFDVISQIPFRVAVVDEAHRLRNQKGKLLECMREISAKGTMQYGFQGRVLMSGTPLQNDLTELWTLLNFIEPFKFPDLEKFQLNFGNMANRAQVESLQRMISPYMLRRVKEDVAKDIPAKEETVIDVELTSVQKQYYRAIFEHNHAFLSMGASRQTAPKLMNIQMELRKVCNHPFLLEGVEHRETERQYKEFMESGKFEGKTPEEQQYLLNQHGYIMTSGKMVLLDKLLPKLRQEGHKLLIFSQMVKMLDLISEYCEFRNFRYERLDGRVRGTDRQKAIDRFEREDDSFIFLLSTRAGGVGINLTAADICIIFDSDWNPQNDIQAQARCHRIGQTKDVRIYRLVTSRSFEQEMFDRASKKLGLEQAVLGTFEKEKEDDKPSEQEMEQLLKKGAYALLEDENDEITNEFCADDIESILAKRTRTRVVEGTKTASWLNKQGMMVTKSKFSAETGGDTLDMDDPLFWQKVMPDFVTPSLMMQKLNELQDEIEGRVGRGRGRGKRGRPKKNAPVAEEKTAEDEEGEEKAETKDEEEEEDQQPEADDDMSEDDDNGNGKKKNKVQLTRTNKTKVQKFMADLKSMMESIIDEDDEDVLASGEKDVCQKLLLTISVKHKIFNEEQRLLAKKFLKHVEGDRRRRCRTSEQPRFNPGAQEEEVTPGIREELMIVGKKKRKRRKVEEVDDEEAVRKPKRRSAENGGYIGEDGFLHHSDSEHEADWSDVGEDIYQSATGKKREGISRKEARRRRQWAAGDDAMTAAGRSWPVFPRHLVRKVLTTVLDEVMKHDEEKGGAFSSPVPRDEFPDYYEQIKKPMDYSTMRTKLENGEYRSAQAMQKDFILILQNCRKYNDASSDIVKEAREQHLMRPKILQEAAAMHNIFLGDDGSVLEIFEDEKQSTPKKKIPRKKKNGEDEEIGENGGQGKDEAPIPRKKGKKKQEEDLEDGEVTKPEEAKPKKKTPKKAKQKSPDDDDVGEANDAQTKNDHHEGDEKVRPRIRIKVKGDGQGADADPKTAGKATKKTAKRKRPAELENVDGDENAAVESEPLPVAKRRKKAELPLQKKKRAKPTTEKKRDTRESSADIFGDVGFWKKERASLDESFDSARAHLTRFGPWKLPANVPEDKFTDIARSTLSKMDRLDRYSVFSKPVTDAEAPDYSKTVKHPMDFGTMREKVAKGAYGEGSSAAGALYKDFLLVFDNCRLYNKEESEVTEEASRVLALLPEAFAAAIFSVAKKQKPS